MYNNNFLPSNNHWRIFVDEIAAIILSTRFFLHHSSINQGPALSAARFDNAAERERQGSREFRFEIANRARAYSVCVCVYVEIVQEACRAWWGQGRFSAAINSDERTRGKSWIRVGDTRRTRLFHDLARRNANNFGARIGGGSTRVGNASFLDVAPLCYSVHSGPELRTGGGKKRTRTILKVRGNFLNVFRVENFLVFFFFPY